MPARTVLGGPGVIARAALTVEGPNRPLASPSTLISRDALEVPRVNLSHLIASYGYWVLFTLIVAESLGVPLPGETALIFAGTYAGHTHSLSPWAIFAVAAVAAIIGDNIGYWIGDQGGYRLLRRYGL